MNNMQQLDREVLPSCGRPKNPDRSIVNIKKSGLPTQLQGFSIIQTTSGQKKSEYCQLFTHSNGWVI